MSNAKPWIPALLSLVEAPLGMLAAGSVRAYFGVWCCVIAVHLGVALLIATGTLGSVAFNSLLVAVIVLRCSVPLFAYRLTRQKYSDPKQWFQRWYVLLAAFVLSLVINPIWISAVKHFVLEAFFVPGRAMATTINHADRIFVDKIFAAPSTSKRGDLVVFTAPNDGPLYVMRMLALPGDSIELVQNVLRVNGEIVQEEYASYADAPYPPSDFHQIEVPEHHFFVLGDNRNLANDSRQFGPVHYNAYYGRPTNIFWSREYTAARGDHGAVDFIPGAIAWDRIGRNLIP